MITATEAAEDDDSRRRQVGIERRASREGGAGEPRTFSIMTARSPVSDPFTMSERIGSRCSSMIGL